MKDNEKIVVLAGDYIQFEHWLKHHIIPITNKSDIERLRGSRIHEIHTEGTWYKNIDKETEYMLKMLGGTIHNK